jgi:3'(2'), 5'-bisphosphate nucleotidase
VTLSFFFNIIIQVRAEKMQENPSRETKFPNGHALLTLTILAALKAGEKVLEIYHQKKKPDVEKKTDGSPLTIADKTSHDLISRYLMYRDLPITPLQNYFKTYTPFPILSEEGQIADYAERQSWDYLWLVDPLDGTKEFIKHNNEFAINLALVHQHRAILGVVHLPAQNRLYFGTPDLGAYKLMDPASLLASMQTAAQSKLYQGFSADVYGKIFIEHATPLLPPEKTNICTETLSDNLIVAVSRSHLNQSTEQYIKNLRTRYKTVSLLYAGSALKFCYVAENSADLYPRLGPTMEWDTAAAHALLKAAGKNIYTYDTAQELTYNNPSLENPSFIAK